MIRSLRAIVLEARFDASPGDVWHALTDAEALSNWFAPFITAGQNVGGIVEMSWDGVNKWPTTIEVWEPERHLRWGDPAPSAPEDRSQPRLSVDWLISSDGGQTVLRLVHSGFGEGANWDDQVEGTLGGWTYFLWNIGYCLTQHRGVRRVMVSARQRVPASRAQFWESLFASGLISVSPGGPSAGAACTVALGRSFDAVVQTSDPPYRFAARMPSLNDALLFIELEAGAPNGFHAGFWLSTYGLPNDTVAELQRALDETVTRLVEVPAPVAL